MKELIIQLKKEIFLKLYHQQAGNLNNSDQNIEFISAENNNYHQIGNDYLQNEMTKERDVAVAASRVFVNGDANRFLNNAFAFCFKRARLSTTGSSDREHIKNVGQISSNMRTLTSKDGNLLSHFDKIDESAAALEKTSLHHHLFNNHDIAANKGKINKNHH